MRYNSVFLRLATVIVLLILQHFSCGFVFAAPNERVLENVSKEVWDGTDWINSLKSEYKYDLAEKPSEIIYTHWKNGAWADSVLITNYYNDGGLLSERKELQKRTGTLLSHELYVYNSQNKLARIVLPDSTWYRDRGIFDVMQSPGGYSIQLYFLTSYIDEIRYKYNSTGLLNGLDLYNRSDRIQDSLFVGNDLHPIQSRRYPLSINLSDTLQRFGEIAKELSPVNSQQTIRMQDISFQSNGHQLSAVAYNFPAFPGETVDKAWDFYNIWYPSNTRTIWIYNDAPYSDSLFNFDPARLESHTRHFIYEDKLGFWLNTTDDSEALYKIYANLNGQIMTRYYSSKIKNDYSRLESYIPGNYYQYFYEPRFQGTNPMKNKQLSKVVEQFLVPINKLNSKVQYHFNWDYNNTWVNSIERSNKYDGSGRLVTSTVNLWEISDVSDDPRDGHWVKDSKYEFEYDAFGSGSMIKTYTWDAGTKTWHNAERITFSYQSFSGNSERKSPEISLVLSNYPNPFNNATVIQFKIDLPSVTTLKIYDLSGKRVRTLISHANLPADEYKYRWDGRDQSGVPVASGVYLYRLAAGATRKTGKCLFVK